MEHNEVLGMDAALKFINQASNWSNLSRGGGYDTFA